MNKIDIKEIKKFLKEISNNQLEKINNYQEIHTYLWINNDDVFQVKKTAPNLLKRWMLIKEWNFYKVSNWYLIKLWIRNNYGFEDITLKYITKEDFKKLFKKVKN